MYNRILVATDGSSLSDKAVKSAIALASTCGAELVALRIVPRNALSYWDAGVTIPISEYERIEAQWQAEGQAGVDKAKKLAQAAGVSAKAVTVRSNIVSDGILAAAKKHKCDLIVMASHGRKGIKRLILGSETQGVLAHTTLPVLVLR